MHIGDLLYTVSGFLVGLLVGMTGVGGGSLMTPLLILAFGIHPQTAVGTDLLYAGFTKIGGAVVHGLHGSVDWRVVGRLASGSVPAACLTLFALSHGGFSHPEMHYLTSAALGAALIATALAVVFRPKLVAWFARRVGAPSPSTAKRLTVATGVILGVLVSVTSVGAGALGATALVLLYPNLPTRSIVGSDIAHAVPLTFVAGIGHLLLRSVDPAVLGALLLGSLPGILLGSRLAIRLPDAMLRFGLAGVLVLVGCRLLL